MMARQTHREVIEGWHPYTEEECSRYTAKGLWKNVTSCDLLDRNAYLYPNKLAFAEWLTEETWLGMQQKSHRLALHLTRLGIGYGDFVVLDLMNTVEAFYLFFGLNRIGAIPVMCLPRHRRAEISHEARLHRVKGVVMPVGEKFDYTGMVDEFRDEIPHARVFLTVGGEAPERWMALEELLSQEIEKEHPSDYLDQLKPVPDDIMCQHLSGGTTGIPKGIPRTYNDQICQWDHFGRAIGYTDESVPLVAVPVLHNAAMTVLYGPGIYRGLTHILCKTPTPEHMFRLVERYRATHVLLIPIQMTYWIDAKGKMKDYDLSSLKTMMGAAEKVKPELVQWFVDERGLQFVNIFGMSEGPIICTRWDNPKEVHMYTVGRPIVADPDAQFRLVDDEGKDVERGQIGEMISRGPLTFKGYFRVPEENKKAFDEQGFMHSGDLMSQREDGRYVVEGRKKDMIKRAGENVYPAAVEDKIVSNEKVAFAAVVGMPDARLGEKLCAFVQPAKGQSVTFQDVLNHLKGLGVAIFELPERFELVDGWPLTPVNKINKLLLRAYITARAVQEGAITKEQGDAYLKRDKLTTDDVIEGRVKIDFSGTPG
ncbi:MAG: AMP-binding protein [Chloroflexi bacterium]|nr:AMP-binding protein [Chloroflexota bacterium]